MDRHDITLRPADGPNPPDLIRDLIREVDNLFTPAADGAGKWMQGKGEAELAKAAEIRAGVVARIAALGHEREQLILQRDREAMAHLERMYQLRTERLKEIIDRLTRLRELGVEVNLKRVASLIMASLGE